MWHSSYYYLWLRMMCIVGGCKHHDQLQSRIIIYVERWIVKSLDYNFKRFKVKSTKKFSLSAFTLNGRMQDLLHYSWGIKV